MRKIGARYIIICTEHMTQWSKVVPIKDCTVETTACFVFKNVITRFGCPKVLMRNQGANFLNNTIQNLTQEFMIHHQKSTRYHPQANDTVEAFNKTLEHVLTKVCNV
jgi:hypothetical protein